jgi:EAL domain-containing protein (putative c-di-GMP-specific phosphodiesterase class I)
MLRDAEAALNRARAKGGGRAELFDASMYQASVERLQLDVDLRRAFDDGEMFTVYQPIVETDGGRIRGFEALARWRHRERGVVAPAQFIATCEEIGLIGRLGQLVLDDALGELVRWRAFGVGDALVANVNVSPVQLAEAGLADEVADALARHGLPGAALCLEITEGSLLEASQPVRDTLARLHAIGVRVNLDDFGTGYGFLTHLRTMPIAAVKIDRSFVGTLPGDRASVAITTALVQLAHGLGIGVIAEGVEQAEQFEFLRSLGCESAQGYWLAEPRPSSAFDATVLAGISARARGEAVDTVGASRTRGGEQRASPS